MSKTLGLDLDERVELEELRTKCSVLESLCLGESFKEVWNYGWQARDFVEEGDDVQELKNKFWTEDREEFIKDKLKFLSIDSDWIP